MLENLLRIGFEEGCDVSWATAQALVRKHRLPEREQAILTQNPLRLEEEMVSRLTPLEWTYYTQCKQDFRLPSRRTSPISYDAFCEERAFLRLFGLALYRRTLEELPPLAHLMGLSWRTPGCIQEHILNVLFECIHDSFHVYGPPSIDTGYPEAWARYALNEYNDQNLLPHSWEGRRNRLQEQDLLRIWEAYADHAADYHVYFPAERKHSAHCLGIALLLATFARQAGAPFIFASVIEGLSNVLWKSRDAVYTTLYEDLINRNLPICPDILKRMTQDIGTSRFEAKSTLPFHHGVIIQTDNGKWIWVDPFNRLIRFLDKEWGLDDLYRNLQRIRKRLPGAKLMALGPEIIPRFQKEYAALSSQAVAASLTLEQRLRHLPVSSCGEELQKLNSFPELRLLRSMAEQLFGASWTEEYDILPWVAMFEWHNHPPKHAFGTDLELYRGNSAFRQRAHQQLLLTFHKWTLALFHSDMRTIQGEMCHPVLECAADPFFTAGLFVLNGINVARGFGQPLPYTVQFHTSSQLLWCETMSQESAILSQDLSQRLALQYAHSWIYTEGVQHSAVKKRLRNVEAFYSYP